MDYYKIVLTELYKFFTLINDDFRAKWIAEDISLWETAKSVEHHLTAYKGGMGSVFNDFVICVQNKHNITHEQEVWANRIFDVLTDIAHCFALKLAEGKTLSLDDIKENSWNMMHIAGNCCIDCGYALMPRSSIDYYIAPSIVEKEILYALKQNSLKKSIDTIMALDLPVIKSEREKTIKLLAESKINYIEETTRLPNYIPSWIMRPCKKCGSNNTAVYRWKKKNGKFVPTKDNLRLSKIARKNLL